MDELHEPEGRERLEASEPEEALRRRDFLERTALTAGLATSLATVLSPGQLVAEAARRQARSHLPSPRNLPIDTFVVLMMENRSFDHYLGWLPGADGRQKGLTYTNRAGKKVKTHRLTHDFQGCAHPDPDHSWDGGRFQLDHGKLDGFARGENDEFAIGYYAEHDLPFIPSAAKAFTTYDRFFCSLLGPTYPNRLYMHAAQSFGQQVNNIEVHPDDTIFNALAQAGVSNRYFYSDIPVSALFGAQGLARSGNVSEYYDRCATGSLPAVSYVDPVFGGINGEEEGISGDEHPHGDVRTGQAFMADVVHAFMESPQWKRGALFIVYDEWGGFFDHVRPPRVPDIRQSRKVDLDYGQMGFRIPAVAVSPWARRHHVDHGIYGFESILSLIRYRFGLAPLTRRDQYARNIARSFDFVSKPRLTPPHLPDPPEVMSVACATAQPASGDRPKEHDLAALESSGFLDGLGFHYVPATASRIFRHPSKLGFKP
ncbi:MAG TPA: alkaline phosphatase family protein [Solirubrobacteraceae bacterium]